MSEPGLKVRVSVKEIYDVCCKKCKKRIRELIRDKITDEMVSQALR